MKYLTFSQLWRYKGISTPRCITCWTLFPFYVARSKLSIRTRKGQSYVKEIIIMKAMRKVNKGKGNKESIPLREKNKNKWKTFFSQPLLFDLVNNKITTHTKVNFKEKLKALGKAWAFMSVPKTRMYFPLKGIADQRLIYKFLYTLPLNFKANAPDSSEWESWVSFWRFE